MTQNEFKPTTFNGEPLTTAKLNQVANNVQYLFERSPRLRYTGGGITRDNALKVITGKTAFTAANVQWVTTPIYFGSYFTAGCRPSVVCQVEPGGLLRRKEVTIIGFNGQVDHTGFQAIVYTSETNKIDKAGWIHWIATGF